MHFNNATSDNKGTVLTGQNPGVNIVHATTSTTSSSTLNDLSQVTNQSTYQSTSQPPESESQKTVIIATVVASCFVVFVLVYLILIRPYLKRRAKYRDEPFDTTRAPMDPAFRRPKKKNCFEDWFRLQDTILIFLHRATRLWSRNHTKRLL